MGTVDGLTKARMLEIEGNSVVSGAIDPTTGHLKLTQHDGDVIDAGVARDLVTEGNTIINGAIDVPSGHLKLTQKDGDVIDAGKVVPDSFGDASETAKGVATLATQAEVIAGVVTGEIVTPATLQGKTATVAETTAGVSTTKLITPATLKQETRLTDQFFAVVDSAWSSGLPKVTFEAGQTFSGTVTAWISGAADDGVVAGARVLVSLVSGGSSWIVTQSVAPTPRFMKQIPITLNQASGVVLYSDPTSTDVAHTYGEGPALFGWSAANAYSSLAGKIYMTCTSTGIVSVEGLLYKAAAPGTAVLATFPVALAPARNQVFVTYTASGFGNVAVCTDGTIRWLSGSMGFFSLNNLRWRTAASVAAGTATFVGMSLAGGFTAANTPIFGGEPGSTIHTPGYTIDADKVCIFEGAVSAPGGAGATANIAQLTGLTPALSVHMACAGTTGFNYLRIGGSLGAAGTGNWLNLGGALGSGQMVSLANLLWLDSTSPSITKFPATLTGGWVAYGPAGTTFAIPSFGKTADGLVLAFGLMNAGTIGSSVTNIPNGFRSRYSSILATVSNEAISRVDTMGPTPWGGGVQGVIVNTGNTAWVSLDGLSWPAYR